MEEDFEKSLNYPAALGTYVTPERFAIQVKTLKLENERRQFPHSRASKDPLFISPVRALMTVVLVEYLRVL